MTDAEEKQQRREAVKSAPSELKKRNIPYIPKMSGRFEIRLKERSSIDFFPGTGRWRIRGTQAEGKGDDSLEKAYKDCMT